MRGTRKKGQALLDFHHKRYIRLPTIFRRSNTDIEELSKKIYEYHEKDRKRAKKERYENLSFISLGWGLAIISIAVTNLRIVDIIVYTLAAIFFLVVVIRTYRKSIDIKVE